MRLLTKSNLALIGMLFGWLQYTHAQVQCAVDVQILEGDTIEMCSNALVSLNATGGFANYQWTGSAPGSGQQYFPSGAGQHIVFAEDGIGCISSDTIEVIVHAIPNDAVQSSAGDTLCSGGTSTLSLNGSYNQYSWTGGVTSPNLEVTQSGNYTVSVIDENSCVATFSYAIEILNFDLVIGGQNSCYNTQLLQASGGSQYSWSTGESSNSIVVSPEETTTYDVTISEGTCSNTLSLSVSPIPSSLDNYTLEDTIYVESGASQTIFGPIGFQSYLWTPNDQLSDSTASSVTFTGTESQNITLTAVHPDGCTIQETFTVIVVDLTLLDGFSPNADGINDLFVIPELDTLKGSLVVWNRWGDIVLQSENYQNDWDGKCRASGCFPQGGLMPDGTYFYHLDVHGITKEGYITLIR